MSIREKLLMKKIKKREKMKKELAAKKGKPSNSGASVKAFSGVSKPKNKSEFPRS